MDYFFIAAGLGLLFIGGELLVRGSVAIAERLGISSLLIGLTVVGFGTSTPELLVSVDAAVRGSPEIALGNVVGSNIANILLILGIAVLVAPLAGWQRTATRDTLVMTVAALALFGLVQAEQIGRLAGAAMLGVLGVYLFAAYWLERRDRHPTAHEQETRDFEDIPIRKLPVAMAAAIGGIAMLVGGASLLVDGAISIAHGFGISEAVIGLTLVAVGTSLPELATAIVAAARKHPDVVLGNVIGSNIFNVLAIIGTTTVIVPIGVGERFRDFDVPLMLGVSAALLVLLAGVKRIGRHIGLVMLAAYAAYTAYLYLDGGFS